jgi:hypothetical protein
MRLQTPNLGVPGVTTVESRVNAGKEWNTSRCSPRCSKGVPSLSLSWPLFPLLARLEPMEHLLRGWNTSRCSNRCSIKARMNACSRCHWNTWNIENTDFREAKVKHP